MIMDPLHLAFKGRGDQDMDHAGPIPDPSRVGADQNADTSRILMIDDVEFARAPRLDDVFRLLLSPLQGRQRKKLMHFIATHPGGPQQFHHDILCLVDVLEGKFDTSEERPPSMSRSLTLN